MRRGYDAAEARPPSAKGVMVVIVILAGLATGVHYQTGGKGLDPQKVIAKAGPQLAGMLGGVFEGGLHLPDLEFGNSGGGGKARKAARFALDQVGDRYRYGASGPNTWDCSGLTQAAWRKAGAKIPRTAKGQLHGLKRVHAPKRGDLIVYRSRVSPSGYHVAIAVGSGQMVEARGRRWGVIQGRIRHGWVGVVRPGR